MKFSLWMHWEWAEDKNWTEDRESRVKCPGIHSNWSKRLSATAWRMWSRTKNRDSEDLFQMKLNQLMKGILWYFYRQAVAKNCPDPFIFLSLFTWKSFAVAQTYLQLKCNTSCLCLLGVWFFLNSVCCRGEVKFA